MKSSDLGRALLAASALALVPASAQAGGFLTARFGAEQGHVTTDHASATYWNPAGLAMRTGTRLVLEGQLAYRTASYTRPVEAIDNPGTGTPDDAIGANSGKATLADPVAAPFFAVATDLGLPNTGFGLSFSVPFGGAAAWDKNDAFEGNTQYPGAVDGPQRWATIEGSIRSMYLTAAAAHYIPSAKLSLGLGLNVVLNEVNVIRARQAGATDDLVDADGELYEGRSWIDVKGTTYSFAAGAIFAPRPDWRIGLSYQSQQWTPGEGYGEQRLEGDLINKFATGNTSATPIEFTQDLPDVIRLGASYFLDEKLTLRAQLEMQRWSVFDKQCVITKGGESECNINPDGSAGEGSGSVVANLDRQFTDSYSIRLGGDYLLNQSIELMGGLTYDMSAVPDETLDASFIDMDKVVFVLGGRFAVAQGLSLVGTLTEVLYFARETDVRSDQALGEPDSIQPPTRVPSSAGKYTQNVFLGTLSVEYEF